MAPQSPSHSIFLLTSHTQPEMPAPTLHPLPCFSASELSPQLGTWFGRELRVRALYRCSSRTDVQLGAPHSQEGEHRRTKSVAKTLGKTGGSLSADLVPLSHLSPLSLLPHPCLFPTGVKIHPDVLRDVPSPRCFLSRLSNPMSEEFSRLAPVMPYH